MPSFTLDRKTSKRLLEYAKTYDLTASSALTYMVNTYLEEHGVLLTQARGRRASSPAPESCTPPRPRREPAEPPAFLARYEEMPVTLR